MVATASPEEGLTSNRAAEIRDLQDKGHDTTKASETLDLIKRGASKMLREFGLAELSTETYRRGQIPQYSGDRNDSKTSGGQLNIVKRSVLRFLYGRKDLSSIHNAYYYRKFDADDIENERMLTGPNFNSANRAAKEISAQMAEELDLDNLVSSPHGEKTFPYLFNFLNTLYTRGVKNFDEMLQAYEELVPINRIHHATYSKMREIIKNYSVSNYSSTHTPQQIEDALKGIDDRFNRSIESASRPRDLSAKVIEALEKCTDQAKTEYDPVGLFKALETPKQFDSFFDQRVQFIKDKHTRAHPPTAPQLSPEVARTRAMQNIHDSLVLMVATLFKDVANSSEPLSFDDIMRKSFSQQGVNLDYTPSPDQLFQEIIRRLNGLESGIDNEKPPFQADTKYRAFKLKEETFYDPEAKRTVKKLTSSKDLQQSTIKEAVKNMVSLLTTEKGFYVFSTDLRALFADTIPKQEGQEMLDVMAQKARTTLTSEKVDALNTYSSFSTLFQEIKILVHEELLRSYSSTDWKDTQDLMDAILEKSDKVVENVRTKIREQYADRGDIPAEILDRCLLHAMYVDVCGIHLALQQYDSMLLPHTREGGSSFAKPTKFRSPVFNAMAEVIRYLSLDDATNHLEVFLPDSIRVSWMNWKERATRGKREWLASRIFGRAAFKNPDEVPMLTKLMRNIARAGNYVQLGGARLEQPVRRLLQDILSSSKGFGEIDFTKCKTSTFTEGWKRLEIVGEAVLKNYVDTHLFKKAHFGKELLNSNQYGGTPTRAMYMDFMTFLYDRYFVTDGNGNNRVGEALFNEFATQQGISAGTRAEFQTYIGSILDDKKLSPESKIDTLKKIVSLSYPIVVFEHSPMEILYREQGIHSQNGVRILDEIREDMGIVRNDSPGRVALKDFEQTLSDLGFVVARARGQSLEKAHELRATGRDPTNIYGDLNNLRGDADYRITPAKINDIMQDMSIDPSERVTRIREAQDLYRKIVEKMISIPAHNTAIDTWVPSVEDPYLSAEEQREQLEQNVYEAERNMKKRIVDLWEQYPNMDQPWSYIGAALPLMDLGAAGDNVIPEAMQASSKAKAVAELGFGAKKAMKKAAMAFSNDPIVEWMKNIIGPLKEEDGAAADNVGKLIATRVRNTFVVDGLRRSTVPITAEDDQGRKNASTLILTLLRSNPIIALLLGSPQLSDMLEERPASPSESYSPQDSGVRPWSWKAGQLRDFISAIAGSGEGSMFGDEMKKYFEEKFGISGLFSQYKMEQIFPRAGLAMISILIIAAIVASKKEKK